MEEDSANAIEAAFSSTSLADELSNALDDLSPSHSSVDRGAAAEHPIRRRMSATTMSTTTADNDTTTAINFGDGDKKSKLLHKRSRSDTGTLVEQLNGEEPGFRRTLSKNDAGVTFAKEPITMKNWAPNSLIAPQPPAVITAGRGKVYRSERANDKLTTRDIAALDFLLGIPLEAEESIVQHGWMLQQRRLETFQVSTEFDGSDDEFDNSTREAIALEPPSANVHNSVKSTADIPSNSHHGRWWEKWIPRDSGHTGLATHALIAHNNATKRNKHTDNGELELPTASGLVNIAHGTPTTMDDATLHSTATSSATNGRKPGDTLSTKSTPHMPAAPVYAPGRRLEGDEAVLVQIPLTIDTVTRQRSIALQAAIREWEVKTAHGLGVAETPSQPQKKKASNKALLDGRIFFSAAGSYPIGIFSLKKYEPKREEAALRRQKLEARGGGGSHFVMPSRDWRGISYRSLLPRKADQTRNLKAFNRFLQKSTAHPTKSPGAKKRRSKAKRHDSDDEGDDSKEDSISDSDSDDDDSSESSSSSEDTYIPGILDDPEMTLGRHRNVMIGDVVTGCIISSTIQFVKPALLKADLNAKFRDRFDGWEPSQSQRKYIGARVVEGIYTLIDPTEEGNQEEQNGAEVEAGTSKINTTAAPKDAVPAIIRMPPSLTLSKIRSAKRQALMAFVRANLEIGTVALAFVYFERLCLSCRVDKSNRRLCFASCLLLASKINEPNEVLVMKPDNTSAGAESGDDEEKRNTNTRKKIKRLQSSIRPSKRSSSMFASLLEFFTQDWNLSLKHLYAAEWGVFAALRFSLHASPSQVAFHYKRLMKTLEWNPALYLGTEMFEQWQGAVATEEGLTTARKKRREVRHVRKQRRIQRELQKEVIRSKQQIIAEKRVKSNSKGKSSNAFQQQPSQKSLSGRIAKKKSRPMPLHDLAAEQIKKSAAAGAGSKKVEPQSDEAFLAAARKLPPRSNSLKRLIVNRGKSPRRSPQKDRSVMGTLPVLAPTAQRSSPSDGGPLTPNTPGTNNNKIRDRSMKLLSRLGMRRAMSSEKLSDFSGRDRSPVDNTDIKRSDKQATAAGLGLPLSPSMPLIATRRDEELGGQLSDSDGSDNEGDQKKKKAESTDQSKSVVIDIPPDGQLEKDDDADADDGAESADGSDELGIVI